MEVRWQDILKEKRTEYGRKIVSALGTQLSAEFGRGFGVRNLFRMVRFAKAFPDEHIVFVLRTLSSLWPLRENL